MEETEIDDSSGILPSREWKKGGIAKTMYTHPSCPGLTCSLTCTSLGPYIMVHGMSLSAQQTKSPYISHITCWENLFKYQCNLVPRVNGLLGQW